MNIKKIADLSGVSVTTVSRVLNHPELVRETTRIRVEQVMKDLNFKPNWFARTLNLGSSETLAVLIPSIDTPFFQKLISGIETICNSKNYTLILCNTKNNPVLEKRHVEKLIERNIDGIILASSNLSKSELSSLFPEGFPRVFVGQDHMLDNAPSCYINFVAAGYQMTNHLLAMNPNLNKKTFTLFLDDNTLNHSNLILQGVKEALNKLNWKHLTVIGTVNDMNSPYLISRKLLKENVLGTLVLCSDDEIALSVMKAIHDAGKRVPMDHAIAGLSNSFFSAISNPSLTSMDQPAKKLGMVAARLLFDQIQDFDSTEVISLNSIMNIRRSCGNRKYIHELLEVSDEVSSDGL